MFKFKKCYLLLLVVAVCCGGFFATIPLVRAQTQGAAFRIMTQSDSGDYIGQNKSWDFSNANNSKISIQSASDSLATFKTEDFAVSYMTFGFASESGKKLTTGFYLPAKRLPFRGAYNGIDISGDGRGCNTILGAFYVHEYVMNNGALEKAAIDFVQTCEPNSTDVYNTKPKLYGSLRYNSSILDSCDAQGCAAAKEYLGFTDKPATTDKPDLVITDVKINTVDTVVEGKNKTIISPIITYKNIGASDISASFYVSMESPTTKDYAAGFKGGRYIDAAKSPIKPNIEYTTSVADYLLTYGDSLNTTFTFYIDRYIPFGSAEDNVIDESNENNNTLTKTITISDEVVHPDFIISDLKIEQRSGDVGKYIYVTVENIGEKALPVNYVIIDIKIEDLDTGDIYIARFSGDYIKGYKRETNTETAVKNKSSNSYRLKATVDSINHLIESNETNNTLEKTISVESVLPDLAITSIYTLADEQNPKKVLYIDTHTIGTMPISDGKITIKVTAPEKNISKEYNYATFVSDMATLGLSEYSWPDGSYEVKAEIDSSHVLNESNENNNFFSKTLTFGSVVFKNVVISNVQAPYTLIHPNEATITWETNIPANSSIFYFEYGKGSDTKNIGGRHDIKLTKNHSLRITNLKSFTTYQYYVTSNNTENEGGQTTSNVAESETKEFTTTSSGDEVINNNTSTQPQLIISNVQVPTSLFRPTEATVTWDTNYPSNSDVHYWSVDKTQENWNWDKIDDCTQTNHSITLKDLKPFTTYYFTVSSNKKIGEVKTTSEQMTFTTTVGVVDTSIDKINNSAKNLNDNKFD
ncbi:MAG: fibronectin type III domain-containing protein, partial [bacterium]